MECVICKGTIEPLRDGNGNVVWEEGNNALPVKEGRCCNVCNFTVVITARLAAYAEVKESK